MIDLKHYADMQVGMPYSLLNMQLGNAHADLDDLARRRDIDRAAREAHMAQHGFRYQAALRRFRAVGGIAPCRSPLPAGPLPLPIVVWLVPIPAHDRRRGEATMRDKAGREQLHSEIDTPLLAVYGAGTILGAGIDIVIGKIAGEAGYWTPLAFLLAVLVAGVNGLVFAELATRSPRAGGPSAYVRRASRRRWLGNPVGWTVVATGVVSVATITTGLSGYVQHFVDWPEWLPRTVLLVVLGAVAVAGAEESAWFMAVTTTLGVIGLLFVLYAGLQHGAEGAMLPAYWREPPSPSDLEVAITMMSGAADP